jgi:hypothetical protein
MRASVKKIKLNLSNMEKDFQLSEQFSQNPTPEELELDPEDSEDPKKPNETEEPEFDDFQASQEMISDEEEKDDKSNKKQCKST